MKPIAFCFFLLACSGSGTGGPNGDMDATIDSPPGDAPAADVGSNDATSDASDGATDSGTLHDAGSECAPCMKDELCCMAKGSPNYGKCVSGACLACCQ